ncbi:HAD family hydrolase [Nonomuraea insulae]|uniref:HAD family hydrolase n=1 Tax=Nonomuraea insulae TaxID=1616787 RepID=A0ABW1CVD3_9ACTN
MKAVVLDAMGVLYRHGNVQGRVLIPYLRDRGCRAPEREIRAAYHAATLGRMSTGAFWAALGLPASDEDYCLRHTLTEGTREALAKPAGDGLGLSPAEVVFVDDRPVDLAPARALGMRTILFRSDDTGAHPDGGRPDHVVGSMPGLVAALRM